jgi:hypothetical protein
MMRNTIQRAGTPASTAIVDQAAHDASTSAAVNPSPATLGQDLLRGAEEIAAFLFGDRKHRRKVYYLAGDAKARLPVFRMGAVICARKSTLLTWVEAQEGQ